MRAAAKACRKKARLDHPRSAPYHLGKDCHRRFARVGATRGNVDCRYNLAAVIADRRRCTGKPKVASEEMLLAMNDRRALVRKRRADAICSYTRFVP